MGRRQLRQVDDLTARQLVVVRHDRDQRVAVQLPVVEAVRQLLGLQAHGGEVESAGGDRGGHFGAGGVDDVEVDAGVARVVVGHHLDHVEGAGECLDQPQAQPSAAQPGQRVQLGLGVVHVGEDALGQGDEQFSGGGQPHRAAGPAEQLGADLVLQPRDLLAERGLRDVALSGGPGEVTGLGNGEEVLEVAQFHRSYRSIWEIPAAGRIHCRKPRPESGSPPASAWRWPPRRCVRWGFPA